MFDRTTLDLRFDAHGRMARAINGHGWQAVTLLPPPAPRAALAALLLVLAERLDPRAPSIARVTPPVAGRPA